ncbi:type II secretion system protein [Clostridium sp.]|uniref:PilW family protein n=1 Tax=Clostridium sp. TaxID=1506 RepID=UPI00283E6950|nr:type II secretion system protein [Clostridium sp.]MDR3598286.1 type II secretion system protein [Clostridium sp.]
MKKKKPGFTLIEMIIALAFTVTILGIASSMFITGNKVFSDSDIKSTLQIEGQAIQEKISDIGMQATGINDVTVDTNQSNNQTNQMNSIQITSYDANGSLQNFIIEKKNSGKVYKDGSPIYEIWINDTLISSDIQSVTLDDDIITAANSKTKTSLLGNINSVEFNILLRKESGYSSVEQSVDFSVTFRNK